LVSTSSALSQTSEEPLISNTLGLGPQVGFYHCPDAIDGAPFLGLVTRIRLSNILALEGAISYVGKQSFDLSDETGQDIAASVYIVPATGSLVIYFPVAPTFMPYVLGGVGAFYVVEDYSQYLNNNNVPDRNKARFGYQLGFGLELPLNKHLALQGDYRYLYIDNAFQRELQYDFSSTKLRSHLVNVGFAVYF
jgi:opacity protein-like surface antigen